MLDGPPPHFTPRSFVGSIARLRLDRLRPLEGGATCLNTVAQISGHDELLTLLDQYRRRLAARAGDEVARRVWPAVHRAQAALSRVEPLIERASLSQMQAIAVRNVVRELVALIATSMAVETPVPPIAWATWQALSRCNAVTGLSPAATAGRDVVQILSEGLCVDVGCVDEYGVPELVGAQVDAASVVPLADDGEQLRLVTRWRGVWTIAPQRQGLVPRVWDYPHRLPSTPEPYRHLGRLGLIVASWDAYDEHCDDLRLRFASGRELSVRRPVWHPVGADLGRGCVAWVDPGRADRGRQAA